MFTQTAPVQCALTTQLVRCHHIPTPTNTHLTSNYAYPQINSKWKCLYLLSLKLHPLNGPLSGTTQVSRYQKGKTNLDFTEARDSEWQWHPLCKSAHRSSQITTPVPHHSVFTGQMPFLPPNQPIVKKMTESKHRHVSTKLKTVRLTASPFGQTVPSRNVCY